MTDSVAAGDRWRDIGAVAATADLDNETDDEEGFVITVRITCEPEIPN